jgi:starch phosphorylase
MIRGLLDQLVNGYFENVDKEEFREIFNNLVYHDRYFVLKDYHAYRKAHQDANEAYKDARRWAASAITNIAKSGIFSSDRSIQEYADLIWHVKPMI